MGLTNQKGMSSFLGRHDDILNVVHGKPKMKYVYLHYLPSGSFRKNRGDEYIAIKPVKPLKIERYQTKDLRKLWRKSNKKEFLKNRKAWRVP